MTMTRMLTRTWEGRLTLTAGMSKVGLNPKPKPMQVVAGWAGFVCLCSDLVVGGMTYEDLGGAADIDGWDVEGGWRVT